MAEYTPIGTCKFCGKAFVHTSHNQKFCSNVCNKRYANSITKSNRYHGTIKTNQTEKQLTETAIKARQENMTYGQYQAMKYLKERI